MIGARPGRPAPGLSAAAGAEAYDSRMAVFDTRPGGDGRLKEVIEECQKRLHEDPADGATALRLAEALLAAGRKLEAVEALNRAGPRLQKAGRAEEAIAVYRRVEELDPRSEVTSSFFSRIELKKLLEAEQQAQARASAPPEPAPDDASTEEAAEWRRKAERVHELRRAIPLLKDVPAFLVELVLPKIRLRSLAAGETLFADGDAGGMLAFVATGEAESFARGDSGERVFLEALRPGDVAGVVPFLNGVPHDATVVARTPVDLLELDRAALAPLTKKHPQIADALGRLCSERILDGVLARSRAFALLPPEDREAVARRLKPCTVKAGEVVVREGDREAGVFLVKSGALRVTVHHGKRDVALALLTPHDLFGDVGTIQRQARTATVTAVTESELLRLSGPDLLAVLAAHPELEPALEEIQLERFAKNAERLLSGR